jgi:hypothetical protein
MRGLLIAVSAAAATPGAHADAAYPQGCFSPPVCVTVERTQATLDFNFESLADQPYTVANYVWVRHRDGTVVAVGQAVRTGQILRHCGCTGQCGGP